MDLTDAIERSTAFLVWHQREEGYWKDFHTLAGESDNWVTAYVGSCLAQCPAEPARRSALKAFHWLQHRNWWQKGWGYNASVPSDTDTTACVLDLAYRLGFHNHWRIRRAKRFLLSSLSIAGGLPTYAQDARIRLYTRLNKEVSFAGWCMPHVCVTARAARLPFLGANPGLIRFLLAQQQAQGYWLSYWWTIPEYATCFALEALSSHPHAAVERARQKAASWLRERMAQLESGGYEQAAYEAAFRLAFMLRMAVLLRLDRSLIDCTARHLLKLQQSGGNWLSAARLRIPPPDITDPENYPDWREGPGGGGITFDQNGYFTTATVLWALVAYLAARQEVSG